MSADAAETQFQDMPASARHPKDVVKESVPYSLKESFKLYFSWKPINYYEKILFNNLSFFPEPANNRRLEMINTPVNDKGDYMHEVLIENTLPPKDGKEPLEMVLIHGYGAALGFFYNNFDGLTKIPGCRLHAIDLMGFGDSSRPDFPCARNDTVEGVHESEDFFVDPLEVWRKKRGLDKFVLMAHSLGGYLSCVYYLKYGKGHITKMVMISPVGVERNDFALEKQETEPDGTTVTRKRTNTLSASEQDQIIAEQGVDLTRELSGKVLPEDGEEGEEQGEEDPSLEECVSVATDLDPADEEAKKHKLTQFKGRVVPPRFMAALWEKNFSPLSILRGLGPLAGKATASWTFSRFNRLDSEEAIKEMNEYSTRVFLDKGSGEYAMTRILAPGALARLPLLDRMKGKFDIDTLWLYGEFDWMSKKDGYKMCQEINYANSGKESGHAKFRIISNAGHHVYVDNSKEFETQVLRFVE